LRLKPPLAQGADLSELAVKRLFVRFMKVDSGATAIELGLIAAGISLAIIVIMNSLVTYR
jgi:pilus assembly protein Flp/PilA